PPVRRQERWCGNGGRKTECGVTVHHAAVDSAISTIERQRLESPVFRLSHPGRTQRCTASTVSVGAVLKHTFADNAFAWIRLINFSNNSNRAGSRNAAPIITQS